MRRASLLGMDPRQGGASHMPGRTAGSSAAAAGQRALRIPSGTAGRSPSMTLARSVTLGLAAGATAASTSASRNITPNAGTAAGGEGRALETGGSSLARTATMPAEDILDLLLGTGDLPTTGTGEAPCVLGVGRRVERGFVLVGDDLLQQYRNAPSVAAGSSVPCQTGLHHTFTF